MENRRIVLTRTPLKARHSTLLARWQSGDAEDCKSADKRLISKRFSKITVPAPAIFDHAISGFRGYFGTFSVPAQAGAL